jgi:hypothetical protein
MPSLRGGSIDGQAAGAGRAATADNAARDRASSCSAAGCRVRGLEATGGGNVGCGLEARSLAGFIEEVPAPGDIGPFDLVDEGAHGRHAAHKRREQQLAGDAALLGVVQGSGEIDESVRVDRLGGVALRDLDLPSHATTSS